MEVWGARRKVNKSDNPCDQCEESGLVTIATGFCRTCNDFLCGICVNQHKTVRGTKHHVLLEGDNMPLKRPTPTDSEKCTVHPDRAVEMYCLDEDILGCTLCFIEGHRTCQNVDIISNLSNHIESSVDMKEIRHASEKQKVISHMSRESVQEFIAMNEHCHAKFTDDYKLFQNEIVDKLKRQGKNARKRANKLKKMNNEKLDNLMSLIKTCDQQFFNTVEKIDNLLLLKEMQRDQLFIAVKRYKKELLHSVDKLEQLRPELNIQEFKLTYDPYFQGLHVKDNLIEVETSILSATECRSRMQTDSGIQIAKASCTGSLSIKKESSGTAEGETLHALKDKPLVERGSTVCEEVVSASRDKSSKEKISTVIANPATSHTNEARRTDCNAAEKTSTGTKTVGEKFKENHNNVARKGTVTSCKSKDKPAVENVTNVNVEMIEVKTSPASRGKGISEKVAEVSEEMITSPACKGKGGLENITNDKNDVGKVKSVGKDSKTTPGSKSEYFEANKNIKKGSPAIVCKATSLIEIKSPDDNYDCTVTAMVEISPSRLILADSENSCLKLIDIDKNKVTHRQPLESRPRDLTLLPELRLAVSLPGDQEIKIYTANQNLSIYKSLRVSGKCHGLACSDDKIVVSFVGPAMVQILNLDGIVIKTIQHNSVSVQRLFRLPAYLTVGSDNKLVYVSDYDKNTVTCVNTEQIVYWVYKDDNLDRANGVAIGGGGCIYVCSKHTHAIHVVSSDGFRLATIPKRKTGVSFPRALCYSNYGQILYVSSSSNHYREANTIRKLQLS